MKSYSAFIFLFLLSVLGCKKKEETCVAGTGGSISFAIFPQHHGATIYGATAYLKFNTQSSPGALSNFDMNVVGEAHESHIHAQNMKCGDYYIYCVGYDSTISQTVKGGIPYSVASGASGEIDITVPVTE